MKERRRLGNGGLLLLLLLFSIPRALLSKRKDTEANYPFFAHLAQASRYLEGAYFICVYNQLLQHEGVSKGKSATEKGSNNNSYYK